MSVYLIDTNIFLRLYVKDSIVQHNDCVALVGALESGQIKGVVPGIVLAEIEWTLGRYYKKIKANITEFLIRLLAINDIIIENEVDWARALAIHAQHNVKFADAIIASGLGSIYPTDVIISYDRDFDKLGVKRLEPKDVLR